MYYRVPTNIRKPFKAGEMVEVCDRSLNSIGRVKIKRAGKKIVTLVDGRQFQANDGWWLGESRAWPFPSIRHYHRSRKINSDVDEVNRDRT